jgi:hyperosmotically inducible periplasmic protein
MRHLGILALLSLALAAGACATVDPVEDTRIEAEVKARLVAEKSANLTRIGVLSTNGVVHLNGTVAGPESREKAEALAGDVRGVRRVVNTLAVRPGP